MRILILGGGGFLGQKLARALRERGTLRGAAISAMTQADLAAPKPVEGAKGAAVDITDKAAVDALIGQGWDVIYHLAAIVSGQAEAEFDLGMRVNLGGALNVFEAARALGTVPVVVFTSSVAVYGGDIPEMIEDWTALNPQTSYGAQKAAAEMILTDMSRKGFIDGRGLRLPTVSIRPGKPNAAASSFMSSIFREPLQGQTANCPVGEDYPIWHTAPRTVIGNLIHAAEVPTADLGRNRCFALPGRTDTVGEMIAAMRAVAGEAPVKLITWNRDPEIERIVMGWRARLNPAKALALGFRGDSSFADNVRFFLADDVARPGA